MSKDKRNPMQKTIDDAEIAGVGVALAGSMIKELGPTLKKFGPVVTAMALMHAALQVLAAYGHDDKQLARYLRKTAKEVEGSGLNTDQHIH